MLQNSSCCLAAFECVCVRREWEGGACVCVCYCARVIELFKLCNLIFTRLTGFKILPRTSESNLSNRNKRSQSRTWILFSVKSILNLKDSDLVCLCDVSYGRVARWRRAAAAWLSPGKTKWGGEEEDRLFPSGWKWEDLTGWQKDGI